MSDESRFLAFGPFRFDVRDRRLTIDGKLVPLTPKAAHLLLAVMNGRGDVVSKESLLKSVWADTFVEEGNLTFHIHAIREALREGGTGQQFIENVPRRGYRFAVPISDAGSPVTADSLPSSRLDAPTAPAEASSSERPIAEGRRTPAPMLLTALIITALVAVGGAVTLRQSQPKRLRVVRYQQLTADRRNKDFARPLLSDASFVYFREAKESPATIVSVTGGETRNVNETLQDFVILDIYPPRGDYLVVRRAEAGPHGQLWILSASGSLRKVGAISCMTAAWSPDGRQIACTTESALYVVSADGNEAQRIVATEGSPESPSWSPDRGNLRFTLNSIVDRERREAIWEVRPDGTGLHRLPLGTPSSNECCGTWTPDGRHFIYESWRNGRAELWTLSERKDLLGRVKYETEALTAGPLNFSKPGVSADGTRIFAVGVPLHGELVRYDRSMKTFVPFLAGISALWIDFSRDGRSVAYVQFPESTLWRANSDGSDARQLTFSPMKTDGCSWSPDGKWIAFRGSVGGGPFKILVLPAEGGAPKPIIAEERDQGIPTWSPDGSRLTFGGVPVPDGNARGETIQIYDVESHQFSTVPGSTNLWTPRWSPDGRYISAITIADHSLRLFDVAKSSWRAIDANHIDNPTWSRDSQFISYNTEGGIRSLRRVRIADGQVEETVSLEGLPLQAYWWSGLALDGSPLILRQLGGSEIYALELELERR